jgi:hypothetical protein
MLVDGIYAVMVGAGKGEGAYIDQGCPRCPVGVQELGGVVLALG